MTPYLSIVRQQYRIRLDVAVNDAVLVQEAQRLEARLADGGDLLLVELRVRHDVGERAALEELHHHPQLVVHQEAVVHVDDVRVVVVAHDHHLSVNTVGLGVVVVAHDHHLNVSTVGLGVVVVTHDHHLNVNTVGLRGRGSHGA